MRALTSYDPDQPRSRTGPARAVSHPDGRCHRYMHQKTLLSRPTTQRHTLHNRSPHRLREPKQRHTTAQSGYAQHTLAHRLPVRALTSYDPDQPRSR
ncbi:MAG: hypothetical protein ACK56F_19455, partial [bacterium]